MRYKVGDLFEWHLLEEKEDGPWRIGFIGGEYYFLTHVETGLSDDCYYTDYEMNIYWIKV